MRVDQRSDPRFLRYVLQTPTYPGYVYAVLAPGATNQIELSREGLRRTAFPSPPAGEQRSRADLLDRRTAAANRLREGTAKLASLASEYEQAVITEVTFGRLGIPEDE